MPLTPHLDVFGVNTLYELTPVLLIERYFDITDIFDGGPPPLDIVNSKNTLLRQWEGLEKNSVSHNRLNCPSPFCVGGLDFRYRKEIVVKYKDCFNCKGTGIKTETCKICGGKRFNNGKPCHVCKGSGKYIFYQTLYRKLKPCAFCKGSGKIRVGFSKPSKILLKKSTCRVCSGFGYVDKNKVLTDTEIDTLIKCLFPNMDI